MGWQVIALLADQHDVRELRRLEVVLQLLQEEVGPGLIDVDLLHLEWCQGSKFWAVCEYYFDCVQQQMRVVEWHQKQTEAVLKVRAIRPGVSC